MKRLKIVLDTNVFLVTLPSHHSYHWVFQAVLNDKFDLCISTEILLEYQEIITQRYGLEKINATLDFLLLLPNVHLITPYFRYPLIEKDFSDNKFVECAIMAGADFIVSNDKHFQILGSFKE
jgi:putative PIN family toxin of toxin-antitoxin system